MNLNILDTFVTALKSRYFICFYFLSILILPQIGSALIESCYYGIASNSICTVFRVPEYEGYYRFSTIGYIIGVFVLFSLYLLFVSRFLKKQTSSQTPSIFIKITLVIMLPFLISLFSRTVLQVAGSPFHKLMIEGSSIDCCKGNLSTTFGSINVDKDRYYCSLRRDEVKVNRCIFLLDIK